MPQTGPVPKLNRTRADKTKVNDRMAWDGAIRGFDLPDDALQGDETWHPMVVLWWEAFRRSPQARLLSSDLQWFTLVGAMRNYQDLWTGQARGRTLRAAEFRQTMTQYLISPGDARRSGIEFVLPDDDENPEKQSTGKGEVTNLADRRKRLIEE